MAETREIEREHAEPAAEGTPQENGQEPREPEAENPPEERKSRPWLWIIGAIILIAAIIYGVRFLTWSRTHVSTDDAYVTGNLVNVSPLVSGTLQQLMVDEGTYVRKGQLIARLDPSGPIDSLRQAQANYQAALSQIPGAERALAYQRKATQADILRAQAGLRSQRARTAGARQEVALTSATVRNQVQQAEAQVDAATAQASQSDAQVDSARAALENYRQAIQTAQRAAQAAAARVVSARAQADRAARDASRYRTLYSEDAVSAQAYDQVNSQAQDLAAQLRASQSELAQAQSQVASARASATQAEAQVQAAIRAAKAAREQVSVAQAGVGLARANRTQIGVQRSNLASTTEQTGSSEADLATALAGQEQVAQRQNEVLTYRAQAQQAQAAMQNAQILYNDTFIYAPSDGMVVRKDSNVGATMSPGTTIVTLAQGNDVWVIANFKETQLQDVRVGQPAEVDVDAFPGKAFKGVVQSIMEATGSATALLPPDNATGNFTKVVQRVPVRIRFVAASEGENKYATEADIQNLRQGMSVTATIDTSGSGNQTSGRTQASGQGQGAAQGSPGTSAPSGSGGLAPSSAPSQGQPGQTAPSGTQLPTSGSATTSGMVQPSQAGQAQPSQPQIATPGQNQGAAGAPPSAPIAPTPSGQPAAPSPPPGAIPGATGSTAGNAAGRAPGTTVPASTAGGNPAGAVGAPGGVSGSSAGAGGGH